MTDTLSTIRRANRAAKSAARRALRHKMLQYDVLSTKGVTSDNLYDANTAKTTQDVIEETLENVRNKSLVLNGDRKRRAPVSQSDKLLAECNVVSPEVRKTWHAKINLYNLLDDVLRQKLLDESTNKTLPKGNGREEWIAREMKLDALARAAVTMWLMAKLDLVNQNRVPE